MSQPNRQGSPADLVNNVNNALRVHGESRCQNFQSIGAAGFLLPPPDQQALGPTSKHSSSMQPLTRYTSSGSRRRSSASSKQSSYYAGTVASSIWETTSSRSSLSTVLDPMEAASPIYGCEFWDHTQCEEMYWLGEEQLWIEHIAFDHMQREYPLRSQCWYCDAVFQPQGTQDGQAEREEAFWRRMQHIAEHIRTGTSYGRLPDHDLIQYFVRRGLIPQSEVGASQSPEETFEPRKVEIVPQANNRPRSSRPKARGYRHTQPDPCTVGHRGGERSHQYLS